MPATHAKVVIIGSGPAGLTAAVYAARANLAPIVFAGHMYGGQLMLTTEVENYPGFPEGIMGPELMEAFREQAERFGAASTTSTSRRSTSRQRPFVVRTDEDEYTADTVIVATGASARWLDIPGEARLRGRGVSTCATCDGAFFREKHIVVVGGGDSAMEEATVPHALRQQGHRDPPPRAASAPSKIMADRALNHAKIEFIWNTAVDRGARRGRHHRAEAEEPGQRRGVDARRRRAVHRDRPRPEHRRSSRASSSSTTPGYIVSARRRAHEHRGRLRRRRRLRHPLQAGHHGGGLGLQGRDGRREVSRRRWRPASPCTPPR